MPTHIFDENQIVNITWKTKRDLKRDAGGKYGNEAVSLFEEYCYTAQRQHTNQVHATLTFMMKAMGWCEAKTRSVRNILVSLGYIELLPQGENGAKGYLPKTYTKVNHLVTKAKVVEMMKSWVSKPDTLDQGINLTEIGEITGKCLKDNNTKCLNDNNLKEDKNINILLNLSTNRVATTAMSLEDTLPALDMSVQSSNRTKSESIELIREYAKGAFNAQRKEVLSPKTEENLTKILNKYGIEDIKSAIDNASTWTTKVKLIRNMVKSEDKFINCLNWVAPGVTTNTRVKIL